MFRSSYVILEISGEHKIRFINLCAHHEIKIWNVSENENKLRLSMSSPCFFEIKKTMKKTNIKVKIVEKKGMYYLFRKMLQQKFFYLFLILCLFLLIFSSNFLWKIDITGNKEISHEDWCELTLNKFRERKLSIQQVIGVADKIQLLDGTQDALRIIREKEIRIYIVSGSIDTTLVPCTMNNL